MREHQSMNTNSNEPMTTTASDGNGFIKIWRNKYLGNRVRVFVLRRAKLDCGLEGLINNLDFLPRLADEDRDGGFRVLLRVNRLAFINHISGYVEKKSVIDRVNCVSVVTFTDQIEDQVDIPGDFLPCSTEIVHMGGLGRHSLAPRFFNQCRRLREIHFSSHFDQSLEAMVPSTVTEISVGAHIKHPLLSWHLPPDLRVLRVQSIFDFRLPLPLPQTLKTLYLGGSVNESPLPQLPSSLTELFFGAFFDSPLQPSDLPPSLTSIRFGQHFNQPIDSNTLPPLLETLVFGKDFNRPLPATLPSTLKELKLPLHYSHSTETLSKSIRITTLPH
ncbi:hypothetical protein CYY_003849 [Polysphondylium violaceum]|uniref:FNIP repeat-containing protein n=1 Tax=Polysphondylium violaceum TaxID=133409 RepID=A0A8J4Q6C4_9MYCE|nr:hypothetical protein CYY_003849 [Polysphondylium violaceum]